MECPGTGSFGDGGSGNQARGSSPVFHAISDRLASARALHEWIGEGERNPTMKLSKKTLGWLALAVGIGLAGGWTLYATNAVGCDGHGGKTTASNAQGTTSDVKTVSTDGGKAGACPAMSGGACCSGAMKKTMAGGACCMGAKATTASAAGSMFPEGTMVTRVAVKGGVDLIFTGNDLAAIRKVLDDHIQTCSANKKSGVSCPKCTVASNEANVVLSVRGKNVDQCCSGLMMTADEKSTGTKATVCPAMQGQASKSVVKTS